MKFSTSLLVISLGLLINPWGIDESLAQHSHRNRYKPPSDRLRQAQRTGTGTTRGCTGSANASLKILAPTEHIARTAWEHPTFLFYLEGSGKHLVRLSVTQSQKSQAIFDQRFLVNRPGWFAVSLQELRTELENNQTYQLTFGLLCNPDKVSESAFRRITIEKVKLPTQVERQVKAMGDDADKARILAEAGIWYDAVAASFWALTKAQSAEFAVFVEQSDLERHDREPN